MSGTPQSIGPYEIDAEIGRGGMGVVYRATDTRLGRTVAIKALPEHLAQDPDRLARFEREAKTLAALNHANIAGIHGVEEHEGALYLVLEYVEGETLAEHLDAGPLSIDEALDIGEQIAMGLEAAHDAGVVHRDLKPANVKRTPDGQVKVLDFGLAKTAENRSSSIDQTHTPTLTTPVPPQGATAPGAILGTAAYMSPEQARGRAVDVRTDIWSFGVVLYECLTGASPFLGETATDSIGAILHKEVDLDRLPPETPPMVRHVLRRCLARDKRQRLQSIADARIELADARAGGEPDLTPAATATGGRSFVPWAVAGVAVAVAAAMVAFGGFRRSPEPRTVVSDIVPASPAARVAISGGPPALSPDGLQLAYVADLAGEQTLFVRDLSTGEEREIFTGVLIKSPFWSPDSRSLGFFAGNQLMILFAGVGRPEVAPGFVQTGYESAGAAWSSDGTIIYPHRRRGMMRLALDGSEPELLLDPFPDRATDWVAWPSFLPDGRRFVFTILDDERTATGIYLGSLDSTEFTRLLPIESNATVTPSGYLVYWRADTLLADRMDLDSGVLRGAPVAIADDVQLVSWPAHLLFDASASGDIVYLRGGGITNESELIWIDLETGQTTPTGITGSLWNPAFSSDGRFLAYDRTVAETSGDIWLRDIARGLDTQITNDRINESLPMFSPDDQTLVFFRGDDLYAIPVNGVGAAELLHESEQPKYPRGFTADGRLVFTEVREDGMQDIWLLDLESKEAERWLVDPAGVESAAVSPDGRWIAYAKPVQDRMQVFIRSFPDGDRVEQVSVSDGEWPAWSADGGSIMFRSGTSLTSVSVETDDNGSLRLSRPETLVTLPPTLLGTSPFALHPDGRRILSMRPGSSAHGGAMRYMQNWAAALEQAGR